MKRVVIIQARMGSSRLPGKILRPLAGKPMLEQEIERVRQAKRVDQIVVATSTSAQDDAVQEWATRRQVDLFRGSEQNVLERYYQAAKKNKADIVVRITADCPLIDPQLIDQVIAKLEDSSSAYDYVSNIIQRKYPRGLDVEAFTFATLKKVYTLAQSERAKEHVTYFIYGERPDLFSIGSVEGSEDNSAYRWTVDHEEDFELVERLYQELSLSSKTLAYAEILNHVKKNPSLSRLNSHILQKTL